jgi:hypothetical protein
MLRPVQEGIEPSAKQLQGAFLSWSFDMRRTGRALPPLPSVYWSTGGLITITAPTIAGTRGAYRWPQLCSHECIKEFLEEEDA